MRPIRFEFNFNGRKVAVEADPEGESRYMVRLFEAGHGRVRIGYLTGNNRTWLAEFYGKRPDQPFSSSKAACKALGEWALTQSGIVARDQSRAVA